MKNTKIQSTLRAGLMFGALTFAALAPMSAVLADAPMVNVTIAKYVDGQAATAQSVNSASFQMNAAWNADNIGAGSGQYALQASGYAPDNTPYVAKTVDMTSNASYSTDEVLDGTIVGSACNSTGSNPSYALAGYSTGDTMEAAVAATPTMTAPAFTGLTSNKFVIVWNTTCVPVTATNVSVTIAKYIDGTHATALNANNASFQMNATWNAQNIGAGSGQYALSATGFNTSTAYEASTGDFTSGASYTTDEVLDSTTVGAECSTSSVAPAYALVGYSSGDTMAAAIAATPTTTAPNFTNLTSNKFVIVWNKTCTSTSTSGSIGGTVTGGIVPGALAVTSVTTVNGTATADGTFAHGWKYTFNITVPDNESHLSMKFANWTNTANSSTIPAANNIRISSAQADNSGATILLTAADTYSTPALNMTSDLDANTPGKQVQVTVEVAVPLNSVNGTYNTSYGVQTL